VLGWEEVTTPTPGPDEVLVRVHAVSVNRTLGLKVRRDGGNYATVLPLVLGNDPSGVVVAVGQDVEHPLLNQRVAVFGGIRCGACEPRRTGPDTQCSQTNPRWRILTALILSEVEQGGMSVAAAYSVLLIVLVFSAIGVMYAVAGWTFQAEERVDMALGAG
jgi:NADPH:quinone reductase-like Zn-dependent oxidoreductase